MKHFTLNKIKLDGPFIYENPKIICDYAKIIKFLGGKE